MNKTPSRFNYDDLDQILLRVAEEKGQGFARKIRSIVETSERRCRVQRFIDNGLPLSSYVDRVVRYYEREGERVYRIQVEKNRQDWANFYRDLQRWAYRFLQRKGVPPRDRVEHTLSCAAEGAMAILSTPFPFDVEFDRWACVVQQNICRRFLEKLWNHASVTPEEAVAIDNWDGWGQNLADSGTIDDQTRFELRHDLLAAIESLNSPTRKQFLLLYYFEERSYDEIAELFATNKNALYKLHFDAMAQLRQIWMAKTTRLAQ